MQGLDVSILNMVNTQTYIKSRFARYTVEVPEAEDEVHSWMLECEIMASGEV